MTYRKRLYAGPSPSARGSRVYPDAQSTLRVAQATHCLPGTVSTATSWVNTVSPALAGGYKKVEAPAAAKLYFGNLGNGATVSGPVKVVFGLSGMGIAPAGVEKAGTGHHHLLLNVDEWDANAPLPASDNFRHFGAGQTKVSLDLKPGQHSLQRVLGDQNHIPHHPVVMSERITITVK